MISSRPEVPVGAPLPGERPLERGAALLGEVRQASGASPGAPLTRADWNSYLDQLIELYRRNGATPQEIGQVLQNTERQRIRGLQATVSMALAAMNAGDLDTATRALNAGQQYVPDGIRTQFKPDGRGGLLMTRQSETNPNQTTQTRVTPQQAEVFALRMLDPKWSLQYEMQRRESDSGLATAAQQRAIAAAAEERNRILFGRGIEEADAAKEASALSRELAAARAKLRQNNTPEAQAEVDRLEAQLNTALRRVNVAAQNTILDNERAAEDSAARRAELERKADESRRADAAMQAFLAYDRARRALEANPIQANQAVVDEADAKLNEALAVAPAEANRRITELMMRRDQQEINRELTRARAERQRTESELNQAKIELAKARAARNEAAIAQNDAKIKLLEDQLALQDRRVALASAALTQRENRLNVDTMSKFDADLRAYLDRANVDDNTFTKISSWALAFYAVNPTAWASDIGAVLRTIFSDEGKYRSRSAFEYDAAGNPIRLNIGGLRSLNVPPGFAPPMRRSDPSGRETTPAPGRASLRAAPTDTQQQQQPRRALPPDITDLQGVLGLDSLGAFP
jgi:hypothetical protein